MSGVYDLSEVSKAVEANHPICMLVVDTNVLMNEPDFATWRATVGPTLFVLSDGTTQELEYIKHKTGSREKTGSQEKAANAIRSLASLLKRGQVAEGIPIESGWVIGTPPPDKKRLEDELEQLEDTVKAFGREDTKLLLLTRECSESFPATPAVLITHEINLYNTAQFHGIPSHLCTGFPIDGLKLDRVRIKDWDQVLRDVQASIKEESVVFEATLTEYKRAPEWLGAPSLVIAQGRGTMYDGSKNRPFLWTIPFYPQNILSAPESQAGQSMDLPSVHLDFLGEDDLGQSLFDGVADMLSDCANISFGERKPTLQNPVSVIEMFTYLDCVNRKATSFDLEGLRQFVQGTGDLDIYWLEAILALEDDVAQQVGLFQGLIMALQQCWVIGHTYTFRFIPSK